MEGVREAIQRDTMKSRSRAQTAIIVMCVFAALLTWSIEAIVTGPVFDENAIGASFASLLLDVPVRTWVLRLAILMVFLVLGIAVSSFVPPEEIAEVDEEEVDSSQLDYYVQEAPAMILGVDSDANIVFFNRRCEEITGHRSEDVMHQSFFDVIVPPRSMPTMIHAVNSVLKQGVEVTHETAWITERGREIVILSDCSPVRDDAGEIVGVTICASEITEFRWSEAEIEAARQPYRPLMDTMMDDGLVAFELDGSIIWASESLALLLECERSELTAMTCAEIACDEDRERLQEQLRECMQSGERLKRRFVAETLSGRSFLAVISAIAVEQSDEYGTSGGFAVIRDIGDIAEIASEAAAQRESLSAGGRDDDEAIKSEVAHLQAELEAAEERVEAAREEARQEARAEVEDLQGHLAEAQREADEALERARAEHEAKLAELTEELAAAEGRVEEVRRKARAEREKEVAHLQAELEAAEERVEAAREEARQEARAEVEDLQGHLAEARREADQALERARAEHEAKLAELTEELAAAEGRVEEVRRKARAEREEEAAHLQAELEAAQERVEAEREEARQEARAEVEDLQGHLAEARREADQALESARAEHEAKLAELTEELAAAEARVEEVRRRARAEREEEVAHLQAELEAAQERVEAAREEARQEARAEVEDLRGHLAEARREADEALESAREEHEAKFAELTEQLSAAEGRVEEVRRRARAEREEEVAHLQAELEAAEERVEAAREEARQEARAEVEDLRGDLAEERREADQALESARAEYEEKLAELTRELAATEQSLEELRAERNEGIARLEEQIAEAKADAHERALREFASRLSGRSVQLTETERRVSETEERLREEYAEQIAELSDAVAAAERRVQEARATALAEQQDRIDQLKEDLNDAERRAMDARKLAREEYEVEIAQSLAEAAKVDERVEQARETAQQEYAEQLDSLADRLAEAEEEIDRLREHHDRRSDFFQQLLDGIPTPVALIDRDDVIQTCNDAFAERIAGMPMSEIIGLTIDEAGQGAGDELIEALQLGNRSVVRNGEEQFYEASFRCIDDVERLHAFRKQPAAGPDGAVVGVVCAMLDLSTLQETQQMLEREREQISTVLHRAPTVVAEVRPDGTTAAVYGASEDLLGWPPEELMGRHWWQTLFPGELQDAAREALGAMRSGGELTDRALPVRTADDETRIISWSSANARGPDRELIGILMVGYDITSRAREQQSRELRLQEMIGRNRRYACLCNALRLTQDPQLSLNEMLAGIVAAIPEAWHYPGITTASIKVYDRERQAGGASGAPVATQSAEIVVSSEVVGRVEVRYHEERAALADGPFSTEERDLLELLAELIGETVERRSAEDSRMRLLEFHQTAAEQANVWFMVLDRERNVVEWNRTAREISGYSRHEVLGHDDLWQMLFPDEEPRREVIREVTRIISGRSTAENWETVITCSDGAERTVSWNGRRLIEDDGTTIGAVLLGRDITDETP